MTGAADSDLVETYHDRIRETVIAHLEPEERRTHHRRLARVLETSGRAGPEVLAVHFQSAGELAIAGLHYAQAAALAAEKLAFEQAASMYRLALTLRPDDGPEGRRLRVELGNALANSGHIAEATQEYLAAAVGAEPAEALALRQRAAIQALLGGHIDEGLAVLRTVLESVSLRFMGVPVAAFGSILASEARLRLRGLHFRERSSDRVDQGDVARINACWSASLGLAPIDPLQATAFQKKGLLLALKTGLPSRIARALAMEAIGTAATDPAGRRTAKLLEASERLVQRVGDPYLMAFWSMAAGFVANLGGRWRIAREFLERAEEAFLDHGTEASWEHSYTQGQCCSALLSLGEIAILLDRLPSLVKEIKDRGDLFAWNSFCVFLRPLSFLASDDPDGAQAQFNEGSGVVPDKMRGQIVVQDLIAKVQVYIYAGESIKAWDYVSQRWTALSRSFQLHVPLVRILMIQLLARSALASAVDSPDPRPFLCTASRSARRLGRERSAWATPLAQLVQAGVAAINGDESGALARLADAARGFDAVDMALYAAATRRRRGELVGGEEGHQLIAQADSWMIGQRIRNPARMSALLAPGFVRPESG
jgi:tetratricopeptide (TPR) repeat protein